METSTDTKKLWPSLALAPEKSQSYLVFIYCTYKSMETSSDTSEYIKNDKNVQYLYDSSIISRMNEMIYDHRNCVQHFHDKLFI